MDQRLHLIKSIPKHNLTYMFNRTRTTQMRTDKYKRLFPNILSRTNKIYHDVYVENTIPVKLYGILYRINVCKKNYLQNKYNIYGKTILLSQAIVIFHLVYNF